MAKTIIRTTDRYAADTNGGMFESPCTYAQCLGIRGYPASQSTSGLLCANNGSGKVRITEVDSFVSSVVGMYAYTVWAATYTTGWYKVIACTADTIDLELAFSIAATCTNVRVGGAFLSVSTATARAAAGDKIITIGGRRQRRGRGRMTTSLRARRY